MSENALKQLKALRAQLRSWNDTLDHYAKVFAADGNIDAEEQKKLDKLKSSISKIEGKVSEKEEELKFKASVTNTLSATTERVEDYFSSTDDIVDHSLVDQGSADDATDTSTDDTVADDTGSDDATDTSTDDAVVDDTGSDDATDSSTDDAASGSEDDKYAAIADTPAVKEFLAGIHNSEGGYVDDPNDPGGKTKFGIAEKREWPAFAAMFGLDASNPTLIKDITKKQVDEYYIKTRFEQNGLDKINSPKVINAIFDQSILTPSLVKKNIKRALVALDSNNKFALNNSEFSAAEITAINASNADKLIEKFVVYQNEYYDGLVKKNPGKYQRYINGWKNRTARLTGFSGGVEDDASDSTGGGNVDAGADAGNTFEVPSGWGLNKIASEKGVSVEDLKAWNADKLKTYRNGSQGFNAGETIVIKNGSSSGGGGAETTFEVPSGWGLGQIASAKGVTIEQLKSWNADKLKTYRNGSQGFNVGEIIVIKGGGSVNPDAGDAGDAGSDDGEVTSGGYIKPAWIKEAEKHMGKKETARMVKDDPWVKLLFEELGAYGWAKDQTTSAANWCAAFVSYCLKKTGKSPLTGFDGMRAQTYADKYGKEITRPAYGAIAVVKRSGGGHIGFVVGYNKTTGTIELLGGNQGGEQVCIITETRNLVAYKIPSSWKVPEQNYLD